MRINLKVKTRAKADSIKELNTNNFVISVKAPPIDNKANAKLIKMLADHFGISRSRINIVSGRSSKNKTVEIR